MSASANLTYEMDTMGCCMDSAGTTQQDPNCSQLPFVSFDNDPELEGIYRDLESDVINNSGDSDFAFVGAALDELEPLLLAQQEVNKTFQTTATTTTTITASFSCSSAYPSQKTVGVRPPASSSSKSNRNRQGNGNAVKQSSLLNDAVYRPEKKKSFHHALSVGASCADQKQQHAQEEEDVLTMDRKLFLSPKHIIRQTPENTRHEKRDDDELLGIQSCRPSGHHRKESANRPNMSPTSHIQYHQQQHHHHHHQQQQQQQQQQQLRVCYQPSRQVQAVLPSVSVVASVVSPKRKYESISPTSVVTAQVTAKNTNTAAHCSFFDEYNNNNNDATTEQPKMTNLEEKTQKDKFLLQQHNTTQQQQQQHNDDEEELSSKKTRDFDEEVTKYYERHVHPYMDRKAKRQFREKGHMSQDFLMDLFFWKDDDDKPLHHLLHQVLSNRQSYDSNPFGLDLKAPLPSV